MRAGSNGRSWAVWAIALAAVLLRLPYLVEPESIDEGGYLAVARQWHGAGPSLYSHLWVDRPPLLITIFQLGAALGGLTALRLIAAIGVGIAVLGAASASRRIAGPTAAIGTAAVAAALFDSPRFAALQVNGELLAAPFVACGIALCVKAILEPASKRAARAGFGAGLLAVAAVLVKQNMLDVVVFGVVTGIAAWVQASRQRSSDRARRDRRPGAEQPEAEQPRAEGVDVPGVTARFGRLAGAAAAGSVAMLIVVGVWTVAHGTSLSGVWDAMYAFRIRSAHLLSITPDPRLHVRQRYLFKVGLWSFMYLSVVALGWSVLRKRAGGPILWGLAATLAWGTFSVLQGGDFWNHYLIELVVPVAIAAGLAFGKAIPFSWRAHWLPAVTAALVVVAALTNWAGGLNKVETSEGTVVGTAIAAASRPGDTLVSVFGFAQTNEDAGLPSPYPYLWALPARVQDPHLAQLIALMAGPSHPTWYVEWSRPPFSGGVLKQVEALVASEYHPAGVVCRKTIYVRDDVVRPVPRASSRCSAKAAVAAPGYSQQEGARP
ncbi:MAG: hypothetical protein JWQ32_2807 [Marmoricola sp.]|nr:hypothetical protein [Marmoricola sp.]